MSPVLIAACLLATLPSTVPAESPGDVALREGRHDEARALYEEALRQGADYDPLVGLGVALGRLGRLEEAIAPLDRAIALDRRRPEAWVERGGLRFLQGRFDEAVADLRRALARAEDEYARDLLATSLHLAGRSDDALREWNRLGRPRLRQLEISGIEHTRALLVREAIPLREGEVLDVRRVRAARLRLQELGVFDRVTLRPVPLEEGQADLDVALIDRKGLARSVLELAAVTGVNLFSERAQVRYSNISGRAVNVAASYRWQENRPELLLTLDWPRPFGWAGKLRLQSLRGRQGFSLDEPLERSLRSLRLSYRRVVGDHTLLTVGSRVDWRSFSRAHPAGREGTVGGVTFGLERRIVDGYRSRVEAGLDGWAALAGSADGFARVSGALTYKAALGPGRQSDIERSVFAARLSAGAASAGSPIDEWFAPGASADMELPLRGHRQTQGGLLAVTPLARSVVGSNLEWRQRVAKGVMGEVALVGFLDSVWLDRSALVAPEWALRRSYHDVGVGLRLGRSGSATIRLDLGYGLLDRRSALTVGLNQTF